MKTGYTDLPLHGGKAPPWLMQRMIRLSSSILEILVLEKGQSFALDKLSDPFWFQALGCLLGFDWHSSGITTTVCGALKNAGNKIAHETGIYFFGGKGRNAIQTKEELKKCDELGLDSRFYIGTSKLVAKIDNACVQDGFSLYHHTFIVIQDGNWGVIQQGLNEKSKMARRYHWSSLRLPSYTCDPQLGIICEKQNETMNLVGKENQTLQNSILELIKDKPEMIEKCLEKTFRLPSRHPVLFEDVQQDRVKQILVSFYENEIENFRNVIMTPNVGPKTLRALALTASLIYDQPIEFKDPARFSFAHGGKDGYPYPVSLQTYEETISFLEKGIQKAKASPYEKDQFLNKLKKVSAIFSPAGSS